LASAEVFFQDVYFHLLQGKCGPALTVPGTRSDRRLMEEGFQAKIIISQLLMCTCIIDPFHEDDKRKGP
jgi:hypothetical protein